MEPIYIRNRILKNRIVLAPMETRLNTMQGDVTNELIDYYAARARGGAAAIIVENTFVDYKESRSSLVSSGLCSDHMIKGKNLLAEAVQENGSLAIIQLSHGGRQANGRANPLQPVAPSLVMCKVTQRMPRALCIPEITEIEDAFAEAAYRAMIAGFDGVEIHGAHGYLVAEFFSPYTNKRTDEYGGNHENRARFAANILKKVRARTNDTFIIGLRINGSDFVEGGNTIKDACLYVSLLNDLTDYFHVSGSIYETAPLHNITSMYVPGGTYLPFAEEVKKVSKKPVIAVGSLDWEMGEKVLQEGNADIIAYGRSLIADPDMPNKLMQGKPEEIRPCCRGNEGCISRFYEGKAIRCELNPACGRESAYKIKKTMNKKRIVIAGGGIAGMEAAQLADKMGHEVILLEKTGSLGGHLIEGGAPDFKEKTAGYLNWLRLQIKSSNVDVRLNTPATSELVRSLTPDSFIIAVGSYYAQPPIPGIERALQADKVLMEGVQADRVVVIGGGLVGSETALTLAEKGKKVTLLEMLSELVPNHEPGSRVELHYRMDQAHVDIRTNHTVKEIMQEGVLCEGGDLFKCDAVVNATGLKANSREAAALSGIVPNTYIIGDCADARKIYTATHEAWRTIFTIESDAE
ncbi:MAG: FAD-dependent oxidoreductase [Eubacteriales bacterium]